jgi:hypothetical protein
MTTRRRVDGDEMGTPPMFAEPERVARQRKRAARPFTFGSCPYCHNGKVGLVLLGGHLVWREHTYRTWSGAPVQCATSGVRLCDVPARTQEYVDAPLCRCGKRVDVT